EGIRSSSPQPAAPPWRCPVGVLSAWAPNSLRCNAFLIFNSNRNYSDVYLLGCQMGRSMHHSRKIFVKLFLGLFALASVWAQQPPSVPTTAPHSGPTGIKGSAGQKSEPCWEQAGISKSVMEQRRSIQESTRSRVREVCSEPNLSEQQKREKIR